MGRSPSSGAALLKEEFIDTDNSGVMFPALGETERETSLRGGIPDRFRRA
ncbi:MAG: hypothetical protein OEV64_01085 [Desulfobulbaceae bacterium]|nr:hypothetical protein [Desulfobulbaceae bacterium]